MNFWSRLAVNGATRLHESSPVGQPVIPIAAPRGVWWTVPSRRWGEEWIPPASRNCSTGTWNIHDGTMLLRAASHVLTAQWSVLRASVAALKRSRTLQATTRNAGDDGTPVSLLRIHTSTEVACDPPLSRATANG